MAQGSGPVSDPTSLGAVVEATLSSLYCCHFAYCYRVKLRGGEPVFDRDPAERDRAIAAEGVAP